MTSEFILLSVVVLLALVFGLINGIIDGGSLVSTAIMTRVLEPLSALVWVAVCEVAGLFLLGQRVASNLGRAMILLPVGMSSFRVMGLLVAALLGAIVWNTTMWRRGVPTSSSHALVGGIVGAAVSALGFHSVHWTVVLNMIVFLVMVPCAGTMTSWGLARFSYWAGEFFTPALVQPFRALQILTLGGVAMVHGSNDGQKSLAMILMAFLATGRMSGEHLGRMPAWTLLLCGGVLSMGVMAGSRRMIQTLGQRLYRAQPLQGFCAQLSTMVLVGGSSWVGYPMSTTQVFSTSVLGAGAAVHPRAVRWDLAGEIGLVWITTIPAAALLAALFAQMIGGLRYVVSSAF